MFKSKKNLHMHLKFVGDDLFQRFLLKGGEGGRCYTCLFFIHNCNWERFICGIGGGGGGGGV